jgi:pSer/pThr/pTyr-binding forkhead associated (FHA) protein
MWSDAGATIVGPEQPGYDPNAATLRADTIDQPARFILRSDTGEVLDEYPLKKFEVSIGRASSSDIPLLRDKLTSRRHATVRYENGHYVLRDERSANGTFVNGQQLGEMTPHLLQDGDRVGIGEHELIFHTYASPSTNVEDLPTVAVPFNPQEMTYRTREDAGATVLTDSELSKHSMENGSSAEAPSPAPATPKADYAASVASTGATNNSSQPNAAPASASAPEPSIPVATSYNFPTPPAPVEPVSTPAPAAKTPTSTPSISTGTSAATTSYPSSRTDANLTFNRLTSIAQPPLPDLTTLMAAVSSLDSQVAALQDQFHATQEAMRNHDAEVAQTANQLRTSVRRVADRMDSTIADVARNREALSWAELSQLLQDVMDNPRDIEYVTKLARKARELNKIFQIYQNVLNTMAECNSLLRGLIGEDR